MDFILFEFFWFILIHVFFVEPTNFSFKVNSLTIAIQSPFQIFMPLLILSSVGSHWLERSTFKGMGRKRGLSLGIDNLLYCIKVISFKKIS